MAKKIKRKSMVTFLNDNHREKLMTQSSTRLNEIEARLLLTFFTQSIMFCTFHCHTLKCRDGWKSWFIKETENEWLLLSASFTAKFELVFILTQEKNSFFQRFHFKPPFEISACFYETITGNLERFQYFNFETNFLKNDNFFQKTGVAFFSWKY